MIDQEAIITTGHSLDNNNNSIRFHDSTGLFCFVLRFVLLVFSLTLFPCMGHVPPLDTGSFGRAAGPSSYVSLRPYARYGVVYYLFPPGSCSHALHFLGTRALPR